MNARHLILAAALALVPVAAGAQGIVRGAQDGAAVGNRAAGPVGGVAGTVVGGAVGGAAGGVKGVLGIPQDATPRRSTRRKAYRTRNRR